MEGFEVRAEGRGELVVGTSGKPLVQNLRGEKARKKASPLVGITSVSARGRAVVEKQSRQAWRLELVRDIGMPNARRETLVRLVVERSLSVAVNEMEFRELARLSASRMNVKASKKPATNSRQCVQQILRERERLTLPSRVAATREPGR